MSTNRQRNIREHLARSGNIDYQVKRSAQKTPTSIPEINLPAQTEITQPESRKQVIMTHLSRTTGESLNFTSSAKSRQEKIMNHIRMTRG